MEVLNITINNRRIKIVNKLINSNSFYIISDLANFFNVSSRTIRYDLDNIDEFLQANGISRIIRKPNTGVKFPGIQPDKNKLLKLIKDLDAYNYILSSDERVYYILNELMQQQDYITINYLAEKLMVSRNTVIKDLKEVKRWLTDYNLKIESATKHGIKVTGEERQLRRAQIEILSDAAAENREKSPVSHNEGNISMNSQVDMFFKDIDISYMEQCVKVVEEELGTVFSDEAYAGLVMHVAIAVKRIKLGKDIIMHNDELHTLESTKEFTVASNLARMLEERFDVDIPADEIGYITVHLLGSNISNTDNDEKENWVELQILTNEIIGNVSSEVNKDLSGDKQLFKGLIEHLRPAVYRLKHGLKLKNPILSEIKSNYSKLFEIVKNSLSPIEVYTGKPLNDEEAGYFAMHFGAALERQKNMAASKMDVLVVCATGIGTAELLSSRLQSTFDINIVAKIPNHQVRDVLRREHVDFIITTVPLEPMEVQCVMVNPVLTDTDVNKLKQYLGKPKTSDSILSRLMAIIENHCSIIDYDGLVGDLKKFLNITNSENKRGVIIPVLKDLITEETVELNVEVKIWEDAVVAGGSLLEKCGAIEHRYIDAMIETVREIGPYIVIAPGIAMPHARPESGVKRVGMSFITLRDTVNFGNKDNDPVKIVVCLCAVDHSTHIKALSELVGLLQNEEFINTAKNAGDKREILKYITN